MSCGIASCFALFYLSCYVSPFNAIVFFLQYIHMAHEKNDTVIQFQSPVVNLSHESQHLRTYIKLDNWEKELEPFDYHQDPTFNELRKNVITESSIIIVTVRTVCSGSSVVAVAG